MRSSHDDGQGATPRRGALRRHGRPAPQPKKSRTDSERISAIAEGAHVPVEDVLREVADFRLALETDMIIAAAALDAELEGRLDGALGGGLDSEAPDLLGDVLDGERAELATFHDRVLGRLADAAASDELALRRTRRVPRRRFTATLTAAAALLTILGVGRTALHTGSPDLRSASNSAALATAQDQYADFSSAVSSQSPGAVRDAATQLHATLQNLINNHAGDPEVARRAAQLLQAEISLLEVRDPAGASAVLAQAHALVTLLQRAAPPLVRASVQPLLDAVATPHKPAPKPSPSASPKPKATPSPTPKATGSPTASSSPDEKKLTP
jgi:hypothetical protein